MTEEVSGSEEGEAPDTGPLPPEAIPVLGKALERAAGWAFKSANRKNQEARADLFGFSMSGLGGCPRQGAYRLARVEPHNPEYAVDSEARQAVIGTWIHEGFLPHFASVLHAAEVEMALELRVQAKTPDGEPVVVSVPGRTDCYTHVMGGGVVDLKTLTAYLTGGIDHDGVYESHQRQVRGYATAARQWGLPVAWVAWLYVDRSSGEVAVAIEPFGREQEEETEERVRWLYDLTRAPDYAQRGERGPGMSIICDDCAWLRNCWGPDAEPGDTSALQVHDKEEIALAARRYKELSKQISALEAEKAEYGAMVGRPPMGAYGDTVISYQRDGEEPDKKAALAELRLHGVPVPMRPRRGNRIIRWGTQEG